MLCVSSRYDEDMRPRVLKLCLFLIIPTLPGSCSKGNVVTTYIVCESGVVVAALDGVCVRRGNYLLRPNCRPKCSPPSQAMPARRDQRDAVVIPGKRFSARRR